MAPGRSTHHARPVWAGRMLEHGKRLLRVGPERPGDLAEDSLSPVHEVDVAGEAHAHR